MTTATQFLAVAGFAGSFADKTLMVILGLAIVVPTFFLVGAVMLSRRGDQED